MKINHTNYEAFLLDFLEGNLEENLVAELLVFLDAHPDIATEFEELKRKFAYLAEDVVGSGISKEALFKNPQPDLDEYEEKLLALLEGDLDEAAKLQLEHDIKIYPALAREFEWFILTRLQPEAISYADKKLLKKKILVNQDQLLALLEGDLDAETKTNVLATIQTDQAWRKEWDLLNKTRLVPEPDVVYPGKGNLKRKAGRVLPLYIKFVKVAAILLMVFSVFFTLFRKQQSIVSPEKPVAFNKPENSSANKIIQGKAETDSRNNSRFVAVKQPIAKRSQKPHSIHLSKVSRVNTPESQKIQPVTSPMPELPVTRQQAWIDTTKLDRPLVKENKEMLASALPEEPKTFKYVYGKDELGNNLEAYLNEQLKQRAKSAIVYRNKPDWVEDEPGFFVQVGAAFLNVFNKVTGKEVKITRTYTEDGNVSNTGVLANGRQYTWR